MSPDELARERRFGRIAAVAAVVSGIALYVRQPLVAVDLLGRPGQQEPAELRYFDRHAGEILASAVMQAVGMLLLAVVALHLYRAIKARRPEEPLVVAVMGVYGPVALALVTVARAVALGVIAGDFADRPTQTLGGRRRRLEDPALLIPQYLGISAVAGAGVLAREGLARRDAGGPADPLHGRGRDRAGPAFVLGFGSLILPAVADRAGGPVRRVLAARPPTRMGVGRGVAVAERGASAPSRRCRRCRGAGGRAATARSSPSARVCAAPAGGAAGETAG